MSVYAAGRALEPHARSVAAALARRANGSGTTLLADAVIEAFVDRVIGMRTDRDRSEFLDWLGTVAASYGEIEVLRPLLDELPGALATAARELTRDAIPKAELDGLASDVRGVVARAWRPLRNVADDRLDELDSRIDALIVRLENRDPLSSEHSRAVAAWCARLGRRLGLHAADVAFATRCGLLHDVGKALTPLEVLNAPRALDEREWRLMRAHAAAGEALVNQVAELRPFAPAVRSHHERLDGRGYPDGLRGSAIPLMARIVAVADCFNAMIGRRPYRLPMAPSRALDELVSNRGTQFDPDIVEAMIDVVMG
jgi:putative nucleotidyltransferase with HDIG domain